MPSTAAKKKRSERLNVRLTEREVRLIRLGAEQRGLNVTDFVLESACTRAEQELSEARRFELTASAWQKFTAALDKPAKSKPRLKRLFSQPSVLDER
ncbi:MAG TPA: DUF1778 domain-containing protein [Dongiaceae bacterium]|nr:DUF1778 domain-containing protein [Dongiaceae bacterium]